MLKAPSLRHRAVALEFHADLPVPVPDQAAGADRLVDIEHDIKAVGNTERGFHLQACAGFRQIAHDTVDNRLMVVEQDARRLERARPRLVPTFHSTPPSTPVSHYRMERSGNRYGDRSNFIKGGRHRLASAGRNVSDKGNVRVTTPATTNRADGTPRRSPT